MHTNGHRRQVWCWCGSGLPGDGREARQGQRVGHPRVVPEPTSVGDRRFAGAHYLPKQHPAHLARRLHLHGLFLRHPGGGIVEVLHEECSLLLHTGRARGQMAAVSAVASSDRKQDVARQNHESEKGGQCGLANVVDVKVMLEPSLRTTVIGYSRGWRPRLAYPLVCPVMDNGGGVRGRRRRM